MTAPRPEYRVLVPGQRHFACVPLHASAISTAACASRWHAAEPRQMCYFCRIGRQHFKDHNPDAAVPVRHENEGCCLRCGRSDLRIIKTTGCCISCQNRTYESLKQRNAKGKPPIKLRLQEVLVPIEMPDGRVEQRLTLVQDEAEAVARVLRGLPDGAKVTGTPPRRTSWNAKTEAFEPVCPECGETGMLLERQRNDALQQHCWACQGDPPGSGWDFAPVRQPMTPMHPETVAAVLNGDPGLVGEMKDTWGPTAYPCACGTGQVEGWLTQPSGRWRTRCQACGAASAEGAA